MPLLKMSCQCCVPTWPMFRGLFVLPEGPGRVYSQRPISGHLLARGFSKQERLKYVCERLQRLVGGFVTKRLRSILGRASCVRNLARQRKSTEDWRRIAQETLLLCANLHFAGCNCPTLRSGTATYLGMDIIAMPQLLAMNEIFATRANAAVGYRTDALSLGKCKQAK